MMKRRTLLSSLSALGLLGLAAAPAFPASGQEGAPPAAGASTAEASAAEFFNGTWRYVGSAQHGTQIIHRAVDRCVEPENFIVRTVAAGRLRDKNPLVRSIAINVSGGDARIVFDGSRTYRTALGSWRTHRFDGDSVRVQIREHNGALVQLFRTDSGTRRNVYRRLPNGQMRLEVTVQANSLERDMTYRLLYRR